MTWSGAFVATKYIAFIAFTAISSFISVNMFMKLSTDPSDQWIMTTFAIALELMKTYLLIRGNTLNHLKMKKQAAISYSIYVASVFLSILASFGFTLTVLDRGLEKQVSSPDAIVYEQKLNEEKLYESDIKDYSDRIESNQKRQAALDPTYTGAFNNLNNVIKDYESKKADKHLKLDAVIKEITTLKLKLAEEKQLSHTTSNMFTLMSQSFSDTILHGITDSNIRMLLLILISILIEIGIVITSPTVPIDRDHLNHFLGEDFSKEDIAAIKKLLYDDTNLKEDLIENNELAAKDEEVKVRKKPGPKPKIKFPLIENLADEALLEEVDPMLTEIKASKTDVPVPIIVENHPQEDMKTRPKINKKRYRAGNLSLPQKDMLVSFISELFKSNELGHLQNHLTAATSANITESYITPFFDLLKGYKGKTGYTLIERLDGTDKYKANYTEDYIISYLTEEV